MGVLWRVALALVMTTGVKAADNEIARSSLKGLKAVKVVIEVTPIASQNGLTEASLRTDVELKLRLAGIRVLDSEDEYRSTPGRPFLVVDVATFFNDQGIVAHSTTVSLYQLVVLVKDSSTLMPGQTWEVSSIGTVGKQNVATLREAVKELLDKFINAQLSVNPR